MLTDGWRPLVDETRLARWMDARGLGSGPLSDFRLLGGGTQNLLLRFCRENAAYVLRRPSHHPRPAANETMRREARLLAALKDQPVPHPALIAACDDPDIVGAAFYLMEPVDGVNVAVDPAPIHCRPDVQHAMGLAMVDAIAVLGELDHRGLGLGTFGRPERYLERQTSRWTRQLESYASFAGWPGTASLPGLGDIAAWLAERRPQSFRPGIIHGDYHIANILFEPDRANVAAIVDWELSTIGDPLIDLGWMLATWAGDDGARPVVRVEPWVGYPTPAELIDRYAAQSSRSVAAIDWYVVLACYKLGIILEGTFARACAGLADRQTGEELHAFAIALFSRALERMHR